MQSCTGPWQRGCLFSNFKALRTALSRPSGYFSLVFFCTKSLPAARANVFLMIQTPNFSLLSPVTMGKYRIAACPRPLTSGRFEPQVSIASARASASTARVIRFRAEVSTRASPAP